MTNEREVNLSETEVLEEETEETIDEDIVSAEETQKIADELDKPDSSPGETEETTEETEEVETDVEPVVEPKQPKPVEGETPREYALRKEVQRLKKDKRDTEQGKIFKQAEKPVEAEPDYQVLLDQGYTEQDIENSKKLISVLAPGLGLVNSKQTYQEKANETLTNFVDNHKEYSPALDKDDVRWGRFQSILKSDYNLNGKTPAQLKSIFAKVDRDVIEELGDIPNSQNKRNAQQQKIKSVSHSAGTKTTPVKTKKAPGETVAGGVKFSGFDDDELA